jgi:hypothetical protein
MHYATSNNVAHSGSSPNTYGMGYIQQPSSGMLSVPNVAGWNGANGQDYR